MRRVRLLRAAAEEALAAAAWYEEQRPGLGTEFRDAIEAALDLIGEESFPLLPVTGQARERGAVRLILKRFPYDLVVLRRPGEAIVIAVAHHARRPGYWRHLVRT
jgi:toxin ParE1/3/4